MGISLWIITLTSNKLPPQQLKEPSFPSERRDLFQLDPKSTVMPELDPSYQGLLFPDLSLEDPDLESIMGDKVSPEMKVMILTAVKQSLANNQ